MDYVSRILKVVEKALFVYYTFRKHAPRKECSCGFSPEAKQVHIDHKSPVTTESSRHMISTYFQS